MERRRERIDRIERESGKWQTEEERAVGRWREREREREGEREIV